MHAQRFLILSVLLFGAAVHVPALEYVEVDGALVLVGSTRTAAAASPLLPGAGVTFPIAGGRLWEIHSGVLLFATTYRTVDGVSYPTEIENRDYWVLALVPDLRAGLRLPFTPSLSLGASLGVALLLRAPIPLFADATADLGPTLEYLYGNLRFLYPETQADLRLSVAEGIDLRLGARVLWPVFHFWDGEGLPFLEQMVGCALVGAIFRL